MLYHRGMIRDIEAARPWIPPDKDNMIIRSWSACCWIRCQLENRDRPSARAEGRFAYPKNKENTENETKSICMASKVTPKKQVFFCGEKIIQILRPFFSSDSNFMLYRGMEYSKTTLKSEETYSISVHMRNRCKPWNQRENGRNDIQYIYSVHNILSLFI